MLEGRNINLRIAEKEDIPILAQWLNDKQFAGDYQNFPVQVPRIQLEKQVLERKQYELEWVDFMIEKKDGSKIGWATHYVSAPNFGWIEVGYSIIAGERNKGYGTEAAQILVDYLFLTKEIVRIQAITDTRNVSSQRVLEKSGFKREGMLRKALWNALGEWADGYIYSILREEWKEPKVLARAVTSTGAE